MDRRKEGKAGAAVRAGFQIPLSAFPIGVLLVYAGLCVYGFLQ